MNLAQAQDYPSHPIKFILPQPAGGAVDLIARALGEQLSEQMQQPVVVENRPGANGGLAAADVARSPPDGYTLFVAVDTNLVSIQVSIPICPTIRSATSRRSACSPGLHWS
jgi:tripartite-type tricarboxylate transporter receptor subunit TctC